MIKNKQCNIYIYAISKISDEILLYFDYDVIYKNFIIKIIKNKNLDRNKNI